MRKILFAAVAAMVAGCAAQTNESVGTGEGAVLSDTVSITQRPDGRFDVLCRGRSGAPDFVQTVTADQIRDDSVCSPSAPPPPNAIAVNGVTLSVAAGSPPTELYRWGAGLWEGYASFEVVLSTNSNYPASATLIDASGAQYPISATNTRFDRLPVPVRVMAVGSTYYTSAITVAKPIVEVQKTDPIASGTLVTKYNSTASVLLQTLGADLPGATLAFTANARFFKNFTDDNACSRVSLVDANNQSVVLDPGTFTQRANLIAPVRVQAYAACVSSRLAAPENRDADVDVAISNVAISAAPSH
jgi:hypothetical protein